ncbi:hypothetical protein ACFC06_21720 [Nocardia sp. NPDC056064]|uniref:hypothetical protein n=1 Tax=Nocardia sp. NPDC056064 TaxID=3345701 RepID=UPI0035DFC397
MGAAARNGLNHSATLDQRKAMIDTAVAQRDVEFTGGPAEYTSGTVHELTTESTPIEREFYGFYRTQRSAVTPEGATPETTTHPTLSSNVKFLNFRPFNDIETISPAPDAVRHRRERLLPRIQRGSLPPRRRPQGTGRARLVVTAPRRTKNRSFADIDTVEPKPMKRSQRQCISFSPWGQAAAGHPPLQARGRLS